MSEPRADKEIGDDGRVRSWVYGGNGELQHRSEWYDNKSNADRGLSDLLATLEKLRDLGRL